MKLFSFLDIPLKSPDMTIDIFRKFIDNLVESSWSNISMFIGHDILKTILQNPNMTWDFIWTHYGEIRRSRFFDENAFYGVSTRAEVWRIICKYIW